MNKESNTLTRGFSRAYYLLPAGIQSHVKNEILKQCEWAPGTFYAKARGDLRIKNPELRILEEIFTSHGIDVNTGAYSKVS
jgi:hypothetical protein